MSEQDAAEPKLEPELARLLVAERTRPGRPQAEIERAYGDADAAIRGTSRARGLPSLGRVAGPVVGLAVGVALGFAWGHAVRPSVEASVTATARTAAPAPIAPPAPTAAWSVVAPAATPARATSSRAQQAPASPPPAPAPATDSLARERALLETARAALVRGDAAAGLDAIARHAREFPKGQLGEERDALRVRALVAAGRATEARAAADSFRATHPDSVLQPSVDAALQALP